MDSIQSFNNTMSASLPRAPAAPGAWGAQGGSNSGVAGAPWPAARGAADAGMVADDIESIHSFNDTQGSIRRPSVAAAAPAPTSWGAGGSKAGVAAGGRAPAQVSAWG